MPIRKVKGGYKWGSKGKVYRNRKDAERQAAAAYASGYVKKGWQDVLKKEIDDFDNRMEQADKNLRIASKKLQSALQSGGSTTSAMKEYKQAEREYKKLSRELKIRERDKRRIAREEKRALIPLKEAAKRVRTQFEQKKSEVVRDFLRYVDSFGIEDNKPLTQIMDVPQTGEGRVFRKIYEKASKDAGIYGFTNRLINHENYKDFNVDEKINQFKNALEESKKFYKDEVREVYLNRIKNR